MNEIFSAEHALLLASTILTGEVTNVRNGWQFIKSEDICQPRFWSDRVFNCPNQPVVGVSWYEAEAFVCWLNSIAFRGYSSYSLPSEKLWQAAAAGFSKRSYPWGDDFNSDLCNCRDGDNRIGKTSAVGIFPKGNIPEGVTDCAGNVWEWCSDWFTEGDDRVLRGGSWSVNAGYCRSAFRYRFVPENRDNGFGFRLARGQMNDRQE